jgi:hypothetical protein
MVARVFAVGVRVSAVGAIQSAHTADKAYIKACSWSTSRCVVQHMTYISQSACFTTEEESVCKGQPFGALAFREPAPAVLLAWYTRLSGAATKSNR